MKEGIHNKYLGYLLIVFSGFSNHVTTSVSPSLLFWLMGVLLLVFSNTASNHLKIKTEIGVLIFIFSVYLLCTQPVLGVPMHRVAGLIVSLSFFPIVFSLTQKLTSNYIYKYSSYFINFSLLLLILEFILRVIYPIEPEIVDHYRQFNDDTSRWIYQYKMSSFMYADSNATAIHLIIIVFFTIYLNRIFKIPYYKWKILILIALLFLTFSRAGIIALVIGLFYSSFYFNRRKGTKQLIKFLSFFGLIFGGFILYSIFQEDLSFKSKIVILQRSFDYLKQVEFPEFILGVGISNSIETLGIYAHNLFLTFLIETGFLGLIFQALILFKISRVSKFTYFIIVPFLVVTLTSINTYTPYLYVALAIICVMDRKMEENSNLKTIPAQFLKW